MERVEVIKGDITQIHVDAIVNAAHESLLGGGGVDGAIHRAAGPELLEACRKLGSCETGDAKITPAFRIPVKWIIHTVGPVWQGGSNNEKELLTQCYYNTLRLAHAHDIKSLAIPAISTGAYKFPIRDAAKIALKEIYHFLETHSVIEKIYLVCFDDKTYKIYSEEYALFMNNNS